ncbi:TonB-dependent receptor domain-containing protein [Sphingorhabdus buctiana]|uniref:TonB-dependent receptor domain-containing protein n=1 Tax=Sphingorhabdus buctiana TaxID=1508805 RepID=A0ABW4MBE2_9SPHN
MQIRYYLAAGVAALSIATMTATPTYAQETTSSVRGSVESTSGPVAGATVTVVHEPSGTTSTTSTASDGSFSTQGLRVGGPFTVTVDASGYQTAQVTDLYLQAGTPFRLPVTLEAAQEIVVTASAIRGAQETSTGPITTLGREEIEGVASINRDVRDLARRDPFATIDLTNSRTIEIAGQNGRLNRFSVDGVAFGDDFGLNNGGLPTNRGPVPLEAIEQFSVKVAPFDITEGNFQGGAINVVLRSGGNRFRGGGFFTYTDDSLTGDKTKGVGVNLTLESKQYGGILSGPIIKDKLFFMTAYERTEESIPFDSGPAGQGFAAPIPGLTQAQIDQVSSIADSVYGYDTLGVIRNADETDEKLAVKLDWNVTDDHRASLTYIRSVGNNSFQRNTSTSTTSPTIGLFSTGYQLTEEVNSGVFQLNSSWSDRLSTELRVRYTDYNRGQIPFGEKTIGQISVCADAVNAGSLTSCSTGVPRIFFGPDQFRHANELNTENLGVEFKAMLDAGDHSIKFLAGYTDLNTFNLFVSNSLGVYYFDSVQDFQNRRASTLTLQNAVPSLNPDDGAANFASQTYTFGVQDDWQVTDDLTLTLGARYDLMGSDDRPPLNANFVARHGFSNRETFAGKGVLQPRFGFDWKATDRLIVRGGVGVFAGGSPNVFLSNSFSNTGQLTNQITILRNTSANGCDVPGTVVNAAQICSDALVNVDLGSFDSSVTNYLTTNTAALAAAPVNAIDPNLKLARQLRATLSLDYDADLGPLGDGWLFGANFLYGNVMQAYSFTDIRSVAIGTLPDGRVRYNIMPGQTGTNQDLIMTNDTRGRSYIGVIRFEKSWDFGLNIGGSYTRSDVKDVNAITSATASSLYGNNAMVNSNGAAYGRSIYEIKDQWKFNVGFKTELFGDNETRFNLFGEYRSGRPYSLTLIDAGSGRSPVFGTVGTSGNPLVYIPTVGDSRVSFATTTDETNFNALVAQFGLDKFRGSILPKNSQTSPDFFKVDLNVSQELPVPLFDGAKIKLFADIENVLNLIDSDWGALRQVPFSYTAGIATVQCLSAATPTGTTPGAGVVNTVPTQLCAQYRYSGVRNPNVNLVTRQSLYGIRVGVKVSF